MYFSQVSFVGLGFVAFLGVSGAADLVAPPPLGLSLEYLSFNGSDFTQEVTPTGASGIAARWAAEISRISGGRTIQLCAGDGVGIYKGTVDTYSPDDWTGDTCPPLKNGDIAEAVWTFTDSDGLTRSISGSLVLNMEGEL